MNSRMARRLIGAAGAAALGVIAGLSLGRARRAVAKASMALTGDWEKQMKAEHRAIRKLLKAMADTELEEAAKRATLLEELSDVLTRHGVEEENIIYPALSACGLAAAVKTQLGEHADMRAMIRELEALAPEDPAWTSTAGRLKDLVYGHFREEERVLFPALHEGAALAGDNDRLTHLVRREGLKVS
jgi:iron-sulfur cluster repair protein YtfE (RIC family)